MYSFGSTTHVWSFPAAAIGLAIVAGCLGAAERPAALPGSGKEAETQRGAEQEDDQELVRQFYARVDALLSKSTDGLVTCHLKSIKAMIQSESVGCTVPVESPPHFANYRRDLRSSIRRFVTKTLFLYTYPDDPDDVKALDYIKRQGRFLVTFLSRVDRIPRYYFLILPENWEPASEYPIIVDLHGSQGWMAPRWATMHIGPVRGREYPETPSENQLPPHFTLRPWARGGYRLAGEFDVWQALQDAREKVKVDEVRQSLTGHSLGGTAAWRIATRSPGYWSAVAINSGAWGQEFTWPWLIKNVEHLPVLVRTGGKDTTVAGYKYSMAFKEALESAGKEFEFIYDPELGHGPSKAETLRMRRWLLKQVRRRPDEFSYAADRGDYTGPDGAIKISIDPAQNPRPSFTCRIEGQTLHIDSVDTPGLEINLGPTGLGLEGQVKVVWNGKEVATRTINLTGKTHRNKRKDPNFVMLGVGYRRPSPWHIIQGVDVPLPPGARRSPGADR